MFEQQTGYPHGRHGYVVDHITPLACGGKDDPSNMQWQSIAEGKAKDKVEGKDRPTGGRKPWRSDDLGGAVVQHLAGTGNRPNTNVQHLGSRLTVKMPIGILLTAVPTMAKRLNLPGDHRPLALVEMAATQVGRHHHGRQGGLSRSNVALIMHFERGAPLS